MKGTGQGDIVVNANTGAQAVHESAWTYVPEGNITGILPTSGQSGTWITISGSRLFGNFYHIALL